MSVIDPNVVEKVVEKVGTAVTEYVTETIPKNFQEQVDAFKSKGQQLTGNPTEGEKAAQTRDDQITGSNPLLPGDASGMRIGKYFSTLRLGKYKRTHPFEPNKWTPTKQIILPLPANLKDGVSAKYTNNIEMNNLGDLQNLDLAGAAGSALLRGSGLTTGILKGAASLVSGATTALSLGQVNIDTGKDEQYATIYQQMSGMAPNPNPTVAFNGPNLRAFTLQWDFAPQDERESKILKQVITLLKAAALPQNLISGTAAVLVYPWLCQINFYPWDYDSKGEMVTNKWGWGENSPIRIKHCFMTSVSTSYSAAGPNVFFNDESPAAVRLSISFQEIEYMLSNDYGGTDPGGKKEGLFGATSIVGKGISQEFKNLIDEGNEFSKDFGQLLQDAKQ